MNDNFVNAEPGIAAAPAEAQEQVSAEVQPLATVGNFSVIFEDFTQWVSSEGATKQMLAMFGNPYANVTSSTIFSSDDAGVTFSGSKVTFAPLNGTTTFRFVTIKAMTIYENKIYNTQTRVLQTTSVQYAKIGGQVYSSFHSIILTPGTYTCELCDKDGKIIGPMSNMTAIDGKGITSNGSKITIAAGANSEVILETRPTAFFQIVTNS